MRYVITLFICLVTSIVNAAPVINAITGTVSESEVITLNVSNINADLSGSSVLCIDSLDSEFNDYWAATNDLTISSTVKRTGDGSASLNFTDTVGGGFVTADSTTDMKWFVSYWFYLSSDWDWGNSTYTGSNKFLSNIKMFRLWSPASINENFLMGFAGYGADGGLVQANQEYIADAEAVVAFNGGFTTAAAKGAWHQWKFEWIENSALGVADGSFKVWFDGTFKAQDTSLDTREDYSNLKRPFIIGFQNVWAASEGVSPDSSDDAPNGFYMDDIYCNNSLVRIEIGDNSTYNSCTHTEIFEITDISGSVVTANVKLGTFESSENLYVFYIDSDGTVSEGYLVGSMPAQESSQSISGTGIITGSGRIYHN